MGLAGMAEVAAAPAPGQTAAFLSRLRRLGAESPRGLANGNYARAKSRSVGQLLRALLSSMAYPYSSRQQEPSMGPVLIAALHMLYFWTMPSICAALIAYGLNGVATRRSLEYLLAGLLCCAVVISLDWQLQRSLLTPGKVRPGLYVPATKRAQRILQILGGEDWHARLTQNLTPWLWTGDLMTLFPFVAFKGPHVEYVRTWVVSDAIGDGSGCMSLKDDAAIGAATGDDPEAARRRLRRELMHACAGKTEELALDWSFPPEGFDPTMPIALVLHGLNGGSAESYVLDFVHTSTQRKWTCVVLIARGLGGVALQSGLPFTGARTTDVAACIDVIAQAAPTTPIVGVGFSMGAIVLANYCGVSGDANKLSCAISISGCYDVTTGANVSYMKRVWHPWLTLELKRTFLRILTGSDSSAAVDFQCHGSSTTQMASQLIDVDVVLSAVVKTIRDFDYKVIVPLYGYPTIDKYYADMSLASHGKASRVSTPLLALHACDDPIADSDAYASVMAAAHPNLWFLITRRGGHVGWSRGWLPTRHRWSFIHQVVHDFSNAVLAEAAGSF